MTDKTMTAATVLLVNVGRGPIHPDCIEIAFHIAAAEEFDFDNTHEIFALSEEGVAELILLGLRQCGLPLNTIVVVLMPSDEGLLAVEQGLRKANINYRLAVTTGHPLTKEEQEEVHRLCGFPMQPKARD